MIRSTIVLAVSAATAATRLCRPVWLSSNVLPTTVESTKTSQSFSQSETPSTGSHLSTAVSVSVTSYTTDAISSTSTSEPIGEAIILQINPLIHRLSKRDTQFVGNNNPSDCTFASVFRLASGQLLQNEVPIYYTGQGYQEFSTQGGLPADAITTTFSITGGELEWANGNFGQAGFCQDDNGKVYITFSAAPSNCQLVSLTAYNVDECQNGQIVSVEISSTILPETTESSTQAESLATTAQNTDTADISISSTIATFTEAETSIATASTTETAGTSTSNAGIDADTSITSPITSAETTTSSSGSSASEDACVQGIGGTNGQPPLESRLSDCSSLYTVTVSPYTSTTSVLKREIAMVIPTAWYYTADPVLEKLAARADGDPTATTIQPTETPAYATYCDSPEAYYEACSEAGVAGFTTTLPTPTSTEEVPAPGCAGRRMVKRAGEALGFEFEENWDVYLVPGYRLF